MAIKQLFAGVMEYPPVEKLVVLPQSAFCQPGNASQFQGDESEMKASEQTAFDLMDAIWAASVKAE